MALPCGRPLTPPAVKFSLFLYCYAIRKSSSQVQVLWEDHRNDIFVNGFSILTNAGGAKLRWFIDPIGATIIALVVMAVWARTAYGEIEEPRHSC